MRAFENRPDTVVVDEPLYAAYLARTGIDHPAREEVIASQPTDLAAAVAGLVRAAAARPPRPLRQAHGAPRLPRHGPALDAALPQRAADPRPGRGRRLVRALPGDAASPTTSGCPSRGGCWSCGTSTTSRCRSSTRATSCARPRRTCAGCATGSASRSPTGCCPGRPARATSDGVWAPHWYAAVWSSTGFEPWRPRETNLSDHDAAVAEACRPIYEALHARRVRV